LLRSGWDINRITGLDHLRFIVYMHPPPSFQNEIDFTAVQVMPERRFSLRQPDMRQTVVNRNRLLAGVQQLPQNRCITSRDFLAVFQRRYEHKSSCIKQLR
jgi:hypothetical protein